MNKQVLVSISGLQSYDTTEAAPIEVVTQGTYYEKEGRHFVSYEEASGEVLDACDVKCLLKISERSVELVKRGGAALHFLFEPEKNHMVCYQTPFGDIIMNMVTTELRVEESSERLYVELLYSLEVNGQFLSENRLKIEVSSAQ